MNQKARKHGLRLLSVALAGTLVAGAIASIPAGAEESPIASAVRDGVRNVTGLVSTDNIRSQYLNTDLVSENTLAKDAEHWIIVELGESSLMDSYLASNRTETFAEYAKSAEARSLTAVLERKHKDFLISLTRAGIEYECKYSYTSLLDGVAIKIKNGDFDKVSGMSGVTYASYSESYATPQAVNNNANAYPTGIYDSSSLKDAPYSVQGEGMVVAILDTGLDFSHPAFQNMPQDGGRIKRDEVSAKLENLEAYSRSSGLTVDQVYYNAKVPFAYDYADNDAEVFPSYSNHGTHVAGIVAGRDDSKEIEIVEEGEARTFVGVAPEAQLVICKVFTDDFSSLMLGGADGIDILAAVSDSVTIGVDVINMSLGTSAGFTLPVEKDHMDQIYQRVEDAGISLVVAASNDFSSGYGGSNGTNLASNPDSATVGSPSTYYSAISVASIQGSKSKYLAVGQGVVDPDKEGVDTVVINETVDATGNEYDFINLLYDAVEEWEGSVDRTKPLSLPYVVIGGVGNSTNYTTSIRNQLRKEPTIALVKRGDIMFADKIQYAMQNGAAACIIYNNVSGTIRMSLGEVQDPIPTCSIGMDAGNRLVAAATKNIGYVTFSPDFEAGPFMSDFSSWGPTPDLKLKPEITAHGGEIISSVPGGYDTQSGTSMASPNMAGAVALLRQYVQKNPEIYGTTDSRELAKRTFQLLMSSTTMALNEDGNPYSPRKQGAGLAGIQAAIDAEAYLTVKTVRTVNARGVAEYDLTGTTEAYNYKGTTGTVVDSDKVKVEFGDDKAKTGDYDMTFTVHNLKNFAVSYTPVSYVMTETLASDLKTVAEKAYMLNPEVTVWVNDVQLASGAKITVAAGEEAKVRVRIVLSANDRNYIESSFVNGMYVEGFIRLEAEGESGDVNVSTVDLGIPFLAFYGDWLDAPMFDYSMYEIAQSDADPSVEEEDKLRASAMDTRPLGLYWDNGYVVPLGSYLYQMSPYDTEIYPDEKKAAVSAFDDTTHRTVYELYMINTGLLRGAKYLEVTITNTVTGEVIYRDLETNMSKSYAMGGSPVGTTVMIEVNPIDWNMPSNVTYRLDMVGQLDYEGGENVQRNSFSFEFTVDTEAPIYTDYRVRYEPYTENGVTKYNVFFDIDVQDNQYVMDIMPTYLRKMPGDEGDQLTLFTQYPIPAYGQKGEVTTLSFEITDYYDDLVNHRGIFEDGMYVAIEDYAFNQNVFVFDICEAKGFAENVSLGEDGKLTLKGTEMASRPDGSQVPINTYNLTLAQYENYNVNVITGPDTSYAGSVVVVPQGGNNASVVTKDREIFALASSGTQVIDVVMDTPVSYTTGETEIETLVMARIYLTISGTPKAKPTPERVVFSPVFNSDYHLDTLEGTLVLNPGQEDVQLVPRIEPWYCNYAYDYTYTFSSSNPTVADIDADGVMTLEKRGTVTITVGVSDENGPTWLNRLLTVQVNNEYNIESYRLYNFYGDGDAGSIELPNGTTLTYDNGVVKIPERYNLMYLEEEAFQYNTDIRAVVLPSTLTSIPDEAFKGCVNLEYILIPSNCTYVGAAAFAGLEKLKVVEFSKRRDPIHKDEDLNEYGTVGTVSIGAAAFRNCTALDTIFNPTRMTTILDTAFSGCTSLTEVDLSGLRIAGKLIFGAAAMNPATGDLTEIPASPAAGIVTVITDENTAIGDYMFFGCTSLQNIGKKSGDGAGASYKLDVQRIGAFAFYGCTSLQIEFGNTVENPVYAIGQGAFYGMRFTEFTLPIGTYTIGGGAFGDNPQLNTLHVPADTTILSCTDAFLGCTNFKQFDVATGNATHYSEGGILYTRLDGGSVKLECYPTGYDFASTTVTLPSNVTKLGAGAFAGTPIVSIDLSNITEIGAYAFESCTQLTTVTLSAELKEIPDGAFANCVKLATINLGAVEQIGGSAFENCEELTTVDISHVTEVGAAAFRRTGITSIDASALKGVGRFAFADTALTGGLDLPVVETLDSYAFANNAGITGTINVGPVTAMGDHVFANLTNFYRESTVTFAAGATVVGAYAFYGSYPTIVNLPSTMHGIGIFAFAEDGANRPTYGGAGQGLFRITIEDGGDELIIGAFAFNNTVRLRSIDLSNTVYIGAQAFMRSDDWGAINGAGALAALNNVIGKKGEISERTQTNDGIRKITIAEGAFFNVGLTSVTFGDIGVLGDSAFTGNSLTTVTLPASFNEYTYQDDYERINQAGRTEVIDTRRAEVYYGAFGMISTLREIRVEGTNNDNGTFFSVDGVLYSRHMRDGEEVYVLEQYPAGKSATSYRILTGTTRIGYGAFYGAANLTEVHIPYTVESIAGYAFFGTVSYNSESGDFMGLTDYWFEGVEAPILETPYTEDTIFNEDYYDEQLGIEGPFYGLWLAGLYYANFTDYFASANYYMLGMTLHCPENGKGYDDVSQIWQMYFLQGIDDEGNLICSIRTEYAAERNTMKTVDGITALPTPAQIREQINAISGKDEKIAAINAISEQVRSLRRRYNNISDARQLTFVSQELVDKLYAVEAEIRAIKAELGIPVAMIELVLTAQPVKLYYYVGEKFDPTGMVVTAVFDDESELIVTDYTISKTGPLTLEDREIVISYNGLSVVRPISVSERPAGGNPNGNNLGLIIGLSVGGAVLLAGAAVAVVLVLRKKKGAGTETAAAEGKEEGTQNNGESK